MQKENYPSPAFNKSLPSKLCPVILKAELQVRDVFLYDERYNCLGELNHCSRALLGLPGTLAKTVSCA